MLCHIGAVFVSCAVALAAVVTRRLILLYGLWQADGCWCDTVNQNAELQHIGFEEFDSLKARTKTIFACLLVT